MRNLFATLIFATISAVVFSCTAMAQAGAAGNNNLYNELAKADPGGPAPVQDVGGLWTGPIEAKKGPVPPLTPLGERLFSLNKSQAKVGEAASNDPWKTCDPFGFPRSAVDQIRFIAFGQMPGKIVVLQSYERIWRDVWMDARELPKNAGLKGGPDSKLYGYSVGHWDGDHTLVIDTVGSDDSTWLDTRGYPHSVEAHVQERYTRVDHNHLEMSVSVDDPKIFSKPFVLGTSNFVWVPKQESEDQYCIPSQAITYLNTISIPVAGSSSNSK
jgi:hypothetical protein